MALKRVTKPWGSLTAAAAAAARSFGEVVLVWLTFFRAQCKIWNASVLIVEYSLFLLLMVLETRRNENG